ncbi:hypothetical protein BDV06DRAFT_213939 [Aspergillus oleicola]
MSWSEVSKGRWERPMDGIEGFFAVTGTLSASASGGREHSIHFTTLQVDLKIPPAKTEAALKRAWTQLRYQQPQIATTVEGLTRIYELAETCIILPNVSADELYAAAPPIKRATMYYLPRTSELALRIQHSFIDGTGVLMLWDQFLAVLAAPAAEAIVFGDEPCRLRPCLEAVLGSPGEPSAEESATITAFWEQYLAKAPGIGPMSNIGSVPIGQCQNTRLAFPQQTTKAIIHACKEKNITVTSAVHAAYIQTLATKLADPATPNSYYLTTAPFDMRRHLPAPYNIPQYAASLYLFPTPFYQDLPAPYWDVASSLNEFYRSMVCGNSTFLQLLPHNTRYMFAVAQMPEYQASAYPKDPLPSSLGILENYVKRDYGSLVTIQDLMPRVEVTRGQSLFFVYTFRDQLQVVYCFNDAHEKRSDIDRCLEGIQSVLIEELLA